MTRWGSTMALLLSAGLALGVLFGDRLVLKADCVNACDESRCWKIYDDVKKLTGWVYFCWDKNHPDTTPASVCVPEYFNYVPAGSDTCGDPQKAAFTMEAGGNSCCTGNADPNSTTYYLCFDCTFSNNNLGSTLTGKHDFGKCASLTWCVYSSFDQR